MRGRGELDPRNRGDTVFYGIQDKYRCFLLCSIIQDGFGARAFQKEIEAQSR